MSGVCGSTGGTPIGEAIRDIARQRTSDQSPERKRVGPLRQQPAHEDPALTLGALSRPAETVTHPDVCFWDSAGSRQHA